MVDDVNILAQQHRLGAAERRAIPYSGLQLELGQRTPAALLGKRYCRFETFVPASTTSPAGTVYLVFYYQ